MLVSINYWFYSWAAFKRNIILSFSTTFFSPQFLNVSPAFLSWHTTSVSSIPVARPPWRAISPQVTSISHFDFLPVSNKVQMVFSSTTLARHWKARLIVLRRRRIYYHAWPQILLSAASSLLSRPQNSTQKKIVFASCRVSQRIKLHFICHVKK